MKHPKFTGNIKTGGYLLLALLVGVVFLSTSHWVEQNKILYTVFLGLGSSGIVAFILGITIERVLSQRLAKDAVEAGLGYLVLPEAREEMRRIYEQKFMCTKHHSTLTLKGTRFPGYILVNNHTVRTFKNITGKRQSFRPRVRYREWFHHDQLRSRLIGFGVHVGSQELSDYQTFISANSVQHKLKDEIPLDKGQECTFWYEIEEVKRDTDVYYETFTHPTVNPIVSFAVDKGEATTTPNIGVWFGFSSSLDPETQQAGPRRKELPGLLLPYGYIELRWWSKKKMEDWHDEQRQKGTEIK